MSIYSSEIFLALASDSAYVWFAFAFTVLLALKDGNLKKSIDELYEVPIGIPSSDSSYAVFYAEALKLLLQFSAN